MINNIFTLRISFVISLIATLGSLYFSEILNYPPCVLCWYQRICMYPLVIIFFTAIWTNDKNYFKYALPLLLLGTTIAIYHNLLYYDVIPDSITPCTQGISCTSKQVEWIGFITIPLLSLTAFLILLIFEIPRFFKRKEFTYE